MTRPAETLKLRIAPETLPARPSVVAFRAKLSDGIYFNSILYVYIFFYYYNNRVITLLYALKSFIFVVARALLLLFCLFGLALFCLSFFYYRWNYSVVYSQLIMKYSV